MSSFFRNTAFLLLILSSFSATAQSIKQLIQQKGSFRKDTVFHLKDGQQDMAVPIVILKGEKPGPVFGIMAGLHGYEYVPIMATQAFLKAVELKKLSGTLVILPIANTPGFYQRAIQTNPLDAKNPNRMFPGNAQGSITDRFANWVTENVIKHVDVFLDMHGGDGNEDLLPFVCYYNHQNKPSQTQKAKALSEASGFQHVVAYDYTLKDTDQSQYAFKEAVQQGKVAISFEIGGLGMSEEQDVNFNKMAIFNVLSYLKMYNVPSSKSVTPKHFNKQTYISVPENGFFLSKIKSGDEVTKGAKLGVIADEFGQTKIEIASPVAGTVLYKIGTPPVNKGETLFCIGY